MTRPDLKTIRHQLAMWLGAMLSVDPQYPTMPDEWLEERQRLVGVILATIPPYEKCCRRCAAALTDANWLSTQKVRKSYICRSCQVAETTEWRKRNGERLRAYRQEYYRRKCVTKKGDRGSPDGDA